MGPYRLGHIFALRGRVPEAVDLRPIVVVDVLRQHLGQMLFAPTTTTWSRHSHRIEPITRSAYAFCQGERGAITASRMPNVWA